MATTAQVSLITLGVADVASATAFYEQLGFVASSASVAGEVTFFHNAGGILALWQRDAMRADAKQAADAEGFRGIALAMNLDSRDEVDAAFVTAAAAGAVVVKAPLATDWGGYSGYFSDADGHLWEAAHNPLWPTGPDGLPQLPV